MEAEDSHRGLESDELVTLAIGYINMKNLRKGLEFLQRASKIDTNNVVIESQANSLAIRLSEIEKQESVHNSMPKNRTILVVDDSATVRKLISGKLEKCGHEVVCAIDGVDALEKIKGHSAGFDSSRHNDAANGRLSGLQNDSRQRSDEGHSDCDDFRQRRIFRQSSRSNGRHNRLYYQAFRT